MSMVDTGIIRRIDDLGRVVLPKEIRKKIQAHDGDAFSISVDEEAKSVLLTLNYSWQTVYQDMVARMMHILHSRYPGILVAAYQGTYSFVNPMTRRSLEEECGSEEVLTLARNAGTFGRTQQDEKLGYVIVPVKIKSTGLVEGLFVGHVPPPVKDQPVGITPKPTEDLEAFRLEAEVLAQYMASSIAIP